jgi:hypothetical protein
LLLELCGIGGGSSSSSPVRGNIYLFFLVILDYPVERVGLGVL